MSGGSSRVSRRAPPFPNGVIEYDSGEMHTPRPNQVNYARAKPLRTEPNRSEPNRSEPNLTVQTTISRGCGGARPQSRSRPTLPKFKLCVALPPGASGLFRFATPGYKSATVRRWPVCWATRSGLLQRNYSMRPAGFTLAALLIGVTVVSGQQPVPPARFAATVLVCRPSRPIVRPMRPRPTFR